jgi:hypothetical protein
MAQALKVEQGAPPLDTSGRYRWIVCALLFFATTINYMDRQICRCSSRFSIIRWAGPMNSLARLTPLSRVPMQLEDWRLGG